MAAAKSAHRWKKERRLLFGGGNERGLFKMIPRVTRLLKIITWENLDRRTGETCPRGCKKYILKAEDNLQTVRYTDHIMSALQEKY